MSTQAAGDTTLHNLHNPPKLFQSKALLQAFNGQSQPAVVLHTVEPGIIVPCIHRVCKVRSHRVAVFPVLHNVCVLLDSGLQQLLDRRSFGFHTEVHPEVWANRKYLVQVENFFRCHLQQVWWVDPEAEDVATGPSVGFQNQRAAKLGVSDANRFL